ncbi:MAG: M20/M25/M40 family metallo-hydrolase, partial [Calditrichaeota bacterium]|nr:M20/M25/M40 family metallo-hydrolase [Calditrichota bacterium]
KIVFFNRPMEVHLLDTFAAYGRAVDQRVRGPAEAGKAGAAGAIVRSVTTKPDNVPHVGTLHYDDAPAVPAVAIGLQDAERLACWLRTYGEVEVLLRLSCRDLGRTVSYNVIGELRGRELPQEVVVVGGHFDSWDQGDGSHDDGAGCIQALEVLDLLKRVGIRPRRTVRVVFFINEEFGLDGARAYAEQAAAGGEYHLAAIESDRGAFTPRGFYVDAPDSIVALLQEWLPVLNVALIEWVRKGGSGADIAQMKDAKALIGYVPDTQRYFDHHHSANDVFAAVHPRELELGAAAMAILAYLIAEEGL